MKLANKIIFMCEKFNGNNVWLHKVGSLKFEDSESVIAVYLRKGDATKALIFFNVNGVTARMVEVDLKMNIVGSFGSYVDNNGTHSPSKLSTGTGVQFFLDNFQKLLEKSMQTVGDRLGRPMEDMRKKIGTGKITNDTGWDVKENIMLALLKTGVSRSTLLTVDEFSGVKIKAEKQDIGGFDLVGFTDKHDELVDVIKKASAELKEKGFGNLIYGTMDMVPSTTKRGAGVVLADYDFTTDAIRVFNVSKKSDEPTAIRTMLHELGHRFYYKFLTQPQRQDLAKKFHDIYAAKLKLDRENSKDAFKQGDVIQLKDKKVQYAGLDFVTSGKRKMGYKFVILDAEDKPTGRFYAFDSMIQAVTSIKTLQDDKESLKKYYHEFMPSDYASTNDREWFAEVFAHGIQNNSKEVLTWLKTLK